MWLQRLTNCIIWQPVFLDQTLKIWSFMEKCMWFFDSCLHYFSNDFYTDEDKIPYLPKFVMASLKVYFYIYLLLFPSLKRLSYIKKGNAEPSQQSNMVLFMKIVTTGKYSCKELHLRYLAGFWTRICIHSFPLTINFDNYIL